MGYAWSDPSGAGQVKQSYHQLVNRDGTSSASTTYDTEGNVTLVTRTEQAGSTRNEGDVRFFTDASGQVLWRIEKNGGAATLPLR